MSLVVARERGITAELLAYLAEVEARKLYLPMGYPSLFEFCVRELKLSGDSALKRIQAARAANVNPGIFTAVADGRLHLSAVCLLAPHLRPENAADLIAAASHKTKPEIAEMLAQRFPRTELLPMVDPLPASRSNGRVVSEPVESHAPKFDDRQHAPAHVGASTQRATVVPLSPQSFAIHVTIESATHEKLRHAQALLSHQIPSGDLAQVLDRVLDLAIGQLEKRKFAATSKPRTHSQRPTRSQRHIPAHVKRAVWERDKGQCTFTSETGHHCDARKFLEYDHIDLVARGGQATVRNLRLRCRSHNGHEADSTFGASFMEARRAIAEWRASRIRRASLPSFGAQFPAHVDISPLPGTGGPACATIGMETHGLPSTNERRTR